ncbi:MAG: hypothetical protein QM831_22925 [Kofleriaceae bacterium]
MRVFLLGICLSACGGAAVETKTSPTEIAPKKTAQTRAANPAAIDVITALSTPEKFPQSFIVPGAASLELDGTPIQAPPAQPELQGVIVDEQTDSVRVAMHVDGLAYALWTERARLLGIVKHQGRITQRRGELYDRALDEPFAELNQGARVRMLKRDKEWEQVRYLGSLELDGWIRYDDLVDRSTDVIVQHGRWPTGLPTITATPGTIIRTEPKWAGDQNQLGIMANGYFLDHVKDIDDVWIEVVYEDSDIKVRGFVSKQDPPGHVHKPHEAETPPAKIQPTGQIAANTCLYAKPNGEAIGFAMTSKDAELSSGRSPGWYTVTVDSPWGPLTFHAHGTSEHSLDTCGPSHP